LQTQRNNNLAIAEFRPIYLADPINRSNKGKI